MKRGMVLYVIEGREDVPLQAAAELVATARSLGVTAVSVADSEDDTVYGWMSLITRGIQEVLFMTVAYDAALDRFEPRSEPVRLCG